MHTTRGKWTSPSKAAPQTPARTRRRGAPCTAAPKAKNFTGTADAQEAARTKAGSTARGILWPRVA
eukprot:6313525-Pyramimonas_sp.AAC.1